MELAPLMLAGTWTGQKPKGYLIAEKLDGVRAWWNGYDFVSRQGNVFAVPDWFKAGMPVGIEMDGELWAGRDRYLDVLSQLKGGGTWSLTYAAFDLPQHGGTAVERIAKLGDMKASLPPWASVVEHVVCEGLRHLKGDLRRIWDVRGEGVMLKAADSRYVVGRSNDWLKVRCVNNTGLLR